MKNMNFVECHLLSYKVNINLNVFSTSMLDLIGGHVDRRNIITIDNGGALNRAMKLDEKLMKPNRFSNGMCNRAILSVSGGPGDRDLPF
jgi:hypothetical protein